jgi:tetratricopeptide (TPR) repeat protein
MRCIVPLLPLLSLGFAPLPLPQPADLEKVDAAFRTAKKAAEELAELERQILTDAAAPGAVRAERERRRQEALRHSAREQARLADVLDTVRHHGAGLQSRADEAALWAGHAWRGIGDYKEALRLYGKAVGRSSDPKARATALGHSIDCHLLLHDDAGVRRSVAALRKEIPQLDADDGKRFEKWAAGAEAQITAKGVKP